MIGQASLQAVAASRMNLFYGHLNYKMGGHWRRCPAVLGAVPGRLAVLCLVARTPAIDRSGGICHHNWSYLIV